MMSNRIAELLQRIDYLEEENRLLREQLRPVSGQWHHIRRVLRSGTADWKAGGASTAAKILGVLMKRSPNVVTKQSLVDLELVSNFKNADFYIHLLRRAFMALEIDAQIETVFGQGHLLTLAGKRAIEARLEKQEAA